MQATAPRCGPPRPRRRLRQLRPGARASGSRFEPATQAAGAGAPVCTRNRSGGCSASSARLSRAARATTLRWGLGARRGEGSRGGALEHRPHLHCLPPSVHRAPSPRRRACGWLGQAELEAGRKPRGGSALSAHARTQGCPFSRVAMMWTSWRHMLAILSAFQAGCQHERNWSSGNVALGERGLREARCVRVQSVCTCDCPYGERSEIKGGKGRPEDEKESENPGGWIWHTLLPSSAGPGF